MDTGALIAMAESLQVAHLIDFQFRFIADGEISALLQAASVIVLPYREVDASGVLMTALAEGRPIVATRVGAMAELLTDGQDALLVPVGDADLLASALSQVLEDRAVRQRLAEGARRLGASIPTWRDIGRETVALYDEVIGPQKRGRDRQEKRL
jgi:glycosyltransferase involved in cell wall biosynthesis